jgi:hypothetical protein
MIEKEHLNKEGLNKIVSLKGVINKKLSKYLKAAFPNHTSLNLPSYLEYSLSNLNIILNPY